MEGFSRKDEGCHQFLDLIPKEREWVVKSSEENMNGVSEEKKLELRLGPPGEDWIIKKQKNISTQRDYDYDHDHESLLSFNHNLCAQNPWKHQSNSHFLHLHSQPCTNRVTSDLKISENNTISPANTVLPNTQKRTAPAPLVGWPPVRSFRKNLPTGSSSKPAPDSGAAVDNKGSEPKPKQNSPKSLFVKINMDGIPIGRKVDLKAYDGYEKLSLAVDELFRDLLAAQSEGGKVIGGLLGNREYTLVYEDNEGDRMLVGDVPWDMFVSTVKRLRVLKSSELPNLSHGIKQRKKQFPFGTTA